MNHDDIFFSIKEDDERLHCTTINELVEEVLSDDSYKEGDEVTIYRWARKRCYLPDPKELVDSVLEDMDNEGFGDPEESSEPTPKMLEAAEVFCRVMREEYVPWQCEIVGRLTMILRR